MRSQLVTLLLEELGSSFSPDIVEDVLAEALDGGESLDTRDRAAMFAFVQGPLRTVLVRRLGESAGCAVAESACKLLVPPKSAPPSAISDDKKRDSIFPSVPDLDDDDVATPPAIAIFQSDAGVRPLVIRNVQARGVTVVVIGSARTLERSAAARWVDVFIVASTFPASEARDLERWIAHREKPASVVVWPAGKERAAFEGALGHSIACPIADVDVLVDIVLREVRGVRARAKSA